MLQAAASSESQAVLFEIAATLSELCMFHGLLRGETPTNDMVTTTRRLWARWSNHGKTVTRVGDEENAVAAPVEVLPVDTPQIFCSDAIILLSVSEASTLVSGTAASFFLRRNISGGPGSGPVSLYLAVVNFVIQLLGEVVAADGIVGMLARRNKSQGFMIDPVSD
ncbi:hypothetical protein TrLO_g138 [Triparma laevis f. longispina]|uniref:Uncharacterized protein n=1 Tax=Triparma laevis f. longispina TaxID=1714387 RepID=A0A9W7BZF9_9STRA|nr:hypothetical protein TrLO_g138 [Triparma laevis f. longispina]